MKRLILILSIIGILYNVKAQNCDTTLFPGGKEYYDTYHDVAGDIAEWKHYNTHDPTVNKQGEWYYMYSTDASWGGINPTGALKRRSKDLVNWEFLGTAFNGVPQSAQNFFKNGYNPNYTDIGIWAPFLFKYKGKYILYYSAPGGLNGVNLAYIGYATSDSAGGPWVDQGMITNSIPGDTINAIDPTVVYDSTAHKLWMAYGSWYTGIYMMELDTATGGIKTPGDRGTLIANRQSPAYGQEGAEINYRNGWYYLFVSYDALGDLYNVRVGRSRHANGPYYDFNGVSMAGKTNNIPMILAPYRFNNHPGWQGTGHCGVYNDSGTYYMVHQGRPSLEPGMMVLHVRKIFWMNDWPLVSPERYAGVPQCPTITADSMVGNWEHMPLIYHSSTSSNFQSTSRSLQIGADSTFNGNTANTWTFNNDTLWLNWSNGDVQKLIVFWGWDWENDCRTILYTGMDENGRCIWGKKVNQEAVDRYTKIISGATYTIRNANSHLLLNVPNNADKAGTSIKQGADNGLSSQLWKIKSAGDGHYYFFPQNSKSNLVLEVQNGSPSNYADLILGPLDGTDKQRFDIKYNNNGFFHITTKVSGDASCADVEGLSIAEGANVFQWVYLQGLNQLWRFKKVDSIPIDTVSVDTFHFSGIKLNLQLPIRVFPNPSLNGKITIDISSLTKSKNIEVSIIDMRGIKVYNSVFNKPSVYKLDANLSKGIYILRINTGAQQYFKKLIVQ